MKKILIFLTAIFLSTGMFGQDLNYVNFRLMKAAINAINASKADTSLSNLGSAGILVISEIVHDSLLAVFNEANEGIAVADTSHTDGDGYFYTQWQVDSILTTLGGGVSIGDVRAEIEDSLNVLRPEVRMLVDTMLFFAPVIGVGNAGDTAAFTLNNVIWGTKWGGSHSLVITKVTGVVAGTSPDIDVALLYHTTYKSGSGQVVFSSDLTITSTTTGDEATINASYDTIASGTWLWLRVDQATAKPTQCVINIYGYLE